MTRVLPSYDGACLANLVPPLIGTADWADWIPDIARDASQVVLLVLDALGWEQLGDRAAVAPTLSSLEGGAITSVCPSTTSTALTSITTGLAPGQHGVVGYRIAVDGEVLNTLRWSTGSRDARRSIVPAEFQPCPVFGDTAPPVISKGEFAKTGFTEAHLRSAEYIGYRTMSGIPVEIDRQLRLGRPFVFAYYDGIDRIAHEFGFGDHYRSELKSCDRMVADILAVLPRGAVLLVTADHGQVDCTGSAIELDRSITERLLRQSGEARFRWLHTRDGDAGRVRELAREAHGAEAWVESVEDVLAQGWFGAEVTPAARNRLGDVAVVARDNHAFVDGADGVPISLIGRHGSLTPAEMWVPLVAGWA